MESSITSVEALLASCVESLSYLPVRSANGERNVLFSQLPAAIIYPAEIVSAEGVERSRVTLECKILAMKGCVERSQEAISEIYAEIRRDFASLPLLLLNGGQAVDVAEFCVEMTTLSETPQVKVAATITFELTVDFIDEMSGSKII